MNLNDKNHQNSSVCPQQERFKCTVCPEPKNLSHITLLCLTNQRSNSTRGRPGQRNGGHGRGNSWGRPPVLGGSHSDASPHYPPSVSCRKGNFQGGYTQWSKDPVDYKDWKKTIIHRLDNGFEDQSVFDDLKQMLDESWREERNIFEPIFSATICGSSGFGPTLTLSDTGSTVAFVDCKHMDNLGVVQAGS